jgi:type II secretory pathway component GspD/PulD (secretin)
MIQWFGGLATETQKAKGAMTTMIARPRKAGRRLCLIAAVAGLAAAAAGVEPAHIGGAKFLRDGKVDKICFDYDGALRYRDYQFPRAQYGYLDFEPAVLKDSSVRLKPRGTLLKEFRLGTQSEGERQRVRLYYDLERWVAPSIHDTGNRFEVRFTPAADPSLPPAPALPPLESGAVSESAAGAVAGSPAGAVPITVRDDLFGDYLKLSAQKPFEPTADSLPAFGGGTAASTPAWPRGKSETSALPVPLTPFAPETADSRAKPPAAAQGGEGSPPAAEPARPAEPPFPARGLISAPAKPIELAAADTAAPAKNNQPSEKETAKPAADSKAAAPAAKYEVIKSTKPFVPEPGQDKGPGTRITGGRGYEFVDLSEAAFQKQVSLTFKDADLQNAIRILARHADLNLVLDPNQIKGRVTLELNNVAVGPALGSILHTNELEMVREPGGIYRVVPARLVRRTATREEVTVHIPLNWVTAEDVKKVLDPIVQGNLGVDNLGNALILTDSPLRVEELVNVIGRIDKPEKQVMLEARLVEMNTDLSRGLGITWDLAKVDQNISKEALGLPISSVLGQQPVVYGYDPVSGAPLTYGRPVIGNVPTAGQLSNPFSYDQRSLTGVGGNAVTGMDSLRVIENLANETRGAKWAFGKDVSIFGTAFQLSALLEAAESANLAKTLVAPRVVSVNNQRANISINRQIPYKSTVIGAGGAQSDTWSYEQIGITMNITPNITNNDYVRMRIEPTQRILIGQVGSARPTVDERVSVTNVIVHDEDTAVVAGLRQQSFTESGLGVPWIQQVPVLGWLFKSKTYGNRKTDLMAFVTPHIIKETQALTDNEKQRYNEIDVQWDLPDYFFDDVKFDVSKK